MFVAIQTNFNKNHMQILCFPDDDEDDNDGDDDDDDDDDDKSKY